MMLVILAVSAQEMKVESIPKYDSNGIRNYIFDLSESRNEMFREVTHDFKP